MLRKLPAGLVRDLVWDLVWDLVRDLVWDLVWDQSRPLDHLKSERTKESGTKVSLKTAET